MRWLHLSDIHYNPKRDGASAAEMRERLPKYLEELGVHADELFVTGDFRHAKYQKDADGDAEQVVEFIWEVAKSVGIVSEKNIHIVPGNHDLTRDNGTKAKKAVNEERVKGIREKYDATKGLFLSDKGKDKDKKFLLSRFGFFERVERALHPANSVWPAGLSPLHTHFYLEKENIVLLYLNTAIACGTDKDEYGRLVIGNDDLRQELKKIKDEHPTSPIIVLAHHGMGNFTEAERRRLTLWCRNHQIRLYLCGDSHKIWHQGEWGKEMLEITVGCMTYDKDESGRADAVFSVGEWTDGGATSITAYKWDFDYDGWDPYNSFNRSVKPYLHQKPPPPTDPKPPFGRGKLIGDVLTALKDSKGAYAVEVSGPPGIGKTTVCRAAIKDLLATEVDLTGRTTKDAALTQLLRSFKVEIKPTISLEGQVAELRNARPGHTLYLDNMEDPQSDPDYTEWFVRFTDTLGWNILYTTRKPLDFRKRRPFDVRRLEMEDAKAMFCHLWGRKLTQEDKEQLGNLLTQLDRHPLTIYLFASQARRFTSIGALINAWEDSEKRAKIQLRDERGPHRSLYTALFMSHETVKSNADALALWGAMSYLSGPLTEKLFQYLCEDTSFNFNDAKDCLCDNCLLTTSKNVPEYEMLAPIKEMAFMYDNSHRMEAIRCLRGALTKFFNAANRDRLETHIPELDYLLPAVAFLEKTFSSEETFSPDELRESEMLFMAMDDYFQFTSQSSLKLLMEAKEYQASGHLLDFLYRTVCKLDDKVKEKKYPISGRFQAFLYQKKGNLERWLNKLKEARYHYHQAEALYKQEKDNLGLANVLHGIGDLEQQDDNHLLAAHHYLEALGLYEKIQPPIGKSYTMGELCRVYALAGEAEQSRHWLEQIAAYSDQIPENVKPYVDKCATDAMRLLQPNA